jgi:hypothetical protein
MLIVINRHHRETIADRRPEFLDIGPPTKASRQIQEERRNLFPEEGENRSACHKQRD